MNGADALISTFVANEVTACFANPGTSEMQFVSALDRNPQMRPVLCLIEGVATGPAGGYARRPERRPAGPRVWAVGRRAPAGRGRAGLLLHLRRPAAARRRATK